jgi:hypothetical protein
MINFPLTKTFLAPTICKSPEMSAT